MAALGGVLATSAVANSPLQVLGEVVAKQGSTISSAGVEATLHNGERFIIFSGDRISTPSDGSADISVQHLGTMQLLPGSEIRIDAAETGKAFVITIVKGGLSSYAFNDGASFQIVTADARVVGSGLQESSGAVRLDDDEHLYVAGLDGEITLENSAGASQPVQPGTLMYTGPSDVLYAQVGASPEMVGELEENECNDDSGQPDDDCESGAGFLIGGGTVATGGVLLGSVGAALVPAAVFATAAVALESSDDDDAEVASPVD